MQGSTFLALFAFFLGLGKTQLLINQDDPRLFDYRPAGPDDSRSPCPGLNALANHGYIHRNGKDINLIELLIGAFQGLGVSPEVSLIVGGLGLFSSLEGLLARFDLESLANHLVFIEHDCSYSRDDKINGNNNDFNMEIWQVALDELIKKDIVGSWEMGKAKSKRILDARRRNPATIYGVRAGAFGAIEAGLVLSALGNPITGHTDLRYIRSLFEEERLPAHLGWRPKDIAVNVFTVLLHAAGSLVGDPNLLGNIGTVVLSTPSDVLQIVVDPKFDFVSALPELAGKLADFGFDRSGLDNLTSYTRGERHYI